MPRRWKEAIRVDPPKNIEDYFTVAGTDGSAAEQVGAVIAQLKILSNAIRTTSYNVPEPLPPEAAVAVENRGSGPWPETAADALAQLREIFTVLEEQLGALKPHDWNKSANVLTGTTPVDGVPTPSAQSLTVLQLAQGASRVAADRLPLVERIIRNAAND